MLQQSYHQALLMDMENHSSKYLKNLNLTFIKLVKGCAPAEVVINDLTMGKIYKEGFVNVDLLKKNPLM